MFTLASNLFIRIRLYVYLDNNQEAILFDSSNLYKRIQVQNNFSHFYEIILFFSFQSITNVMRNSAYLTRLALNLLIVNTNSYPLVRMTAKEFMFGYKSTLVTLGNKMMPSWIKFDKLGLIDRVSFTFLTTLSVQFF